MTTPVKRPKRTPETLTDVNGTTYARIALREPGTFAVLDADDASTWTHAGLTWQWGLSRDGYVVASLPRKGPISVARLLLAARSGERVVYIDGDRRNLRRSNLRISTVGATAAAFDAFHQRQATRRAAEEAQERS